MRISIGKLGGVAGKPKLSRNKSNKLSKSKSKGYIKPTQQFLLKFSKKTKLKSSSKLLDSKFLTKLNSTNKQLKQRTKSKSVLKNSRPIYTKLQERRRKVEEVYQLAQTCQHQQNESFNSNASESQESMYSHERKKLKKKSKISLIKTNKLELRTSLNESKDDWIQCPTIEEDYINSYGPKRKTKIDLKGRKKLTRFQSQPVIDL